MIETALKKYVFWLACDKGSSGLSRGFRNRRKAQLAVI